MKLNEEEKAIIERALLDFKKFQEAANRRVRIDTTHEFLHAVGLKMEGKFWFKLNTTVRCGKKEALAFLLDVVSRSLLTNRDVEGEKRVLDEGDNSQVMQVVEHTSGWGNFRCMNKIVRKMVWQKNGSNFILVGRPTETSLTPMLQTNVRRVMRQSALFGKNQESLSTMKDETSCAVSITQVNENECNLEMLVAKPSGPPKNKDATLRVEVTEIEQKIAAKFLPHLYDFRTLSTMQRCFQLWLPLESLDERDGNVMGKMLTENTSKLRNVSERSEKARRKKLDWFFGEFKSMKSLRKEHPWFETMLEAVILSNKHTGAGGKIRYIDKMR